MTITSCEARNEQTKTALEKRFERSDYLYMLLVLAVGLLSYVPWLGSYGLLDPTDSFFLESGRELLEKNEFLLPLNNYVPWLDKPILFFLDGGLLVQIFWNQHFCRQITSGTISGGDWLNLILRLPTYFEEVGSRSGGANIHVGAISFDNWTRLPHRYDLMRFNSGVQSFSV